MKTRPPVLLAMCVAFACAANLPAQIITTFGNSATNGGNWTYTPATSTISGTEGLGDLIFGTPITMNLGANRSLQLTGNATVAPAGSFTISLVDNIGNTAIAQYTWAQFVGGATANKPIQFSTFDFGNVASWSLDSGGSLQSVNASFSQLLAVVPEPSAYAACFAAFLGLWIVRREIRRRRVATAA